MTERRLLLVHAHPDDESIATGGTMARYVAEGARVTLVTCTRGEQGEIVPEDLRHLGTGKPLADARVEELAEAMRVLGVTDHRFLGPYEDSGMIGTPENERATAFWNADLDEATAHLVKVVHEVRPHVVVTYDENGGYGHPDHIQAHRVTMLAVDAAAPEWVVPKVYQVAWGGPERRRREAEDYERAGRPGGFDLPDPAKASRPPHPPTTTIDIAPYLDAKLRAIAAHRTQVTVVGRFFALSNNVAHEAFEQEQFTLVGGADRDETDLFDGIDA
ncbi:MAG TPA: N-acetyl-1-D-myo-inositol-2-amino-2-deoxy-alpha-D-glucopyranoside deacetylase [Mycobacteriales bacterium]|nr:N-acetyl-1-D-myo-inositol-2-amino-2-deoxy-alpha-D-glucopyranoside deacetylase [Mycobacteriales bacterium]